MEHFCAVFPKFSGSEKPFGYKSGCQDFPSKIFVSQCRKVWQGNPFVLSFRKLPVSKKFMHRRGGYQDFPSKVSCSTMPKTFGKRTLLFCFSENFRWRIRLWIRGGGRYQDFQSKAFCTTMPKTLAREPFCVVFQKTSGSK